MSALLTVIALALVGFDHPIHDGKVVAAAVEPPTCASCHRLDAAARPARLGHETCFSSGCHREKEDPAGAPLCLACHDDVPAKGRKNPKAAAPPYTLALDFSLRFGHDRHAAPSHAPGRKGCEQCHRAPRAAHQEGGHAGRPAGAPHARCTACHDGRNGPAMSDCTTCHRMVAGRILGPRQIESSYSVAKSFSHDTHQARSPSCLPCHAGVELAGSDEIPAPTMASCEACHEGTRAFPARGTTCRRCHTQGDGRALPSLLPALPFDHASHGARGLTLACASCHRLDAAGRPRSASPDHTPCNDPACHASDFDAREPRICGGCHIGTEPFRALRADAPRRPRTEFGVAFSHQTHLGGATPRTRAACADCHVGIAGGPERRLGRGHASCSGEACHASSSATGTGAPADRAPKLEACDGCHVQDLLPARDRARAESRWSVAARFRHVEHDATPCESCHVGVLSTGRLDEIRAPVKPSCAPCHDGRKAFKMTGHGCTRCHSAASAR